MWRVKAKQQPLNVLDFSQFMDTLVSNLYAMVEASLIPNSSHTIQGYLKGLVDECLHIFVHGLQRRRQATEMMSGMDSTGAEA